MAKLLCFICLIIASSLLCAQTDTTTVTQPNEFIVEATYPISEGESMMEGQFQALEMAKRDAIDKAGVYITTLDIVKNFQLVETQIKALSGGFTKFFILEQRNDYDENFNVICYVKIRALIELSRKEEIENFINNRQFIAEYLWLRSEYVRLNAEIARLRRNLTAVSSSTIASANPSDPKYLEQIKAMAAIKNAQNAYEARVMYQEAKTAIARGKTRSILSAKEQKSYDDMSNTALQMDPGLAEALKNIK